MNADSVDDACDKDELVYGTPSAPAYTPGDPGANTFQSQFFFATCPQPECIQASVAGPWIVIDGTPPPPGDDTIYYFDTDAIGSVRLITDAAGNEAARKSYLPFGSEWGSTSTPNGNADRVKFAGKERDGESGLDYSLARYLSDNLGRFLSADDVMFGRPGDPQSWNLYAYARNNLLRFVDPTGHEAECFYDSCVSAPMPNDDLLNWLMRRWFEPIGSAATGVAQQLTDWVSAPRDPSCVAGGINAGGALGSVAGGYIGGTLVGGAGAIGGTLVEPGGGTLGGGYAAAMLGSTAGTIVGSRAGGVLGGALGWTTCMGDTTRGGGGGGPQDGLETMTAGQIISRFKKASVREVFPGEYLNKTLAQIRELASRGDASARTALKLLTNNRFNK